MTSPTIFVSVRVASRRPGGLWERLRPRTSNESRRAGSHIHYGLSLDKRCATLSRKVFRARRERDRTCVRSFRDRINYNSLILNPLHLVESALEVGLRPPHRGDCAFLCLQNT